MAINITDFDKIWASTSPLTPYAFSDANYKQGWNFVGATPPARQMWDFLQKNNDEKMQYLANNYLPLSGGTMTGAITLQNGKGYLRSYSNGTYLYGDTGNSISSFVLYTNEDGSGFRLIAGNGTTSTHLVGRPDGTLTWDGKNVERVNASGTNYIRYESGLQICWGNCASSTSGASSNTFPVAFSAAPKVVTQETPGNIDHTLYMVKLTNITETGFQSAVTDGTRYQQWVSEYIAVGLWK